VIDRCSVLDMDRDSQSLSGGVGTTEDDNALKALLSEATDRERKTHPLTVDLNHTKGGIIVIIEGTLEGTRRIHVITAIMEELANESVLLRTMNLYKTIISAIDGMKKMKNMGNEQQRKIPMMHRLQKIQTSRKQTSDYRGHWQAIQKRETFTTESH